MKIKVMRAREFAREPVLVLENRYGDSEDINIFTSDLLKSEVGASWHVWNDDNPIGIEHHSYCEYLTVLYKDGQGLLVMRREDGHCDPEEDQVTGLYWIEVC